MATKIRDVAVKTGEYMDRNTGETKGRWQNVGSLMKNEDDDSLFVILDRTFNPAGVPNADNRSSVILSCFIPQDRRQGEQGQASAGYGGQAAPPPAAARTDLDDEIPFN